MNKSLEGLDFVKIVPGVVYTSINLNQRQTGVVSHFPLNEYFDYLGNHKNEADNTLAVLVYSTVPTPLKFTHELSIYPAVRIFTDGSFDPARVMHSDDANDYPVFEHPTYIGWETETLETIVGIPIRHRLMTDTTFSEIKEAAKDIDLVRHRRIRYKD